MDSYLGSLVQSCCREAGTLQTSLACVGRFTVSGLHWLCPHSLCVCFPGLHCSASRLLCWELSKADPGLHALPRSKPLRFRCLGTPQRRRLGWACGLWPSQVQAAPANRCLASALSPDWGGGLITSPVPAAWLPGRAAGVPLRCAMCLLWELISGYDPPGRCHPYRIPGRLGWQLGAYSQFGRGCHLWG